MKKNGFTLIEMLGVIVLLALVSIIVILAVDKPLHDSKKVLSSIQIENIRSAASMWRTDNIERIPDDGYYTIFLSTLQDNGYIDNEVIDLGNDQVFDRNLLIKVAINDILIGDEIDYSNFDDEILIMANNEVDIINDGISNAFGLEDGIYYFDSNGNLEKDGFIISLNNNSVVSGNILVHNHKFISGCLSYNDHNYDYYKGTLTKYDYPCSTVRGENLVINGDLSYHDGTNFSSNLSYNSNGYMEINSSSLSTVASTKWSPVDISNSYEMGVTVMSNDSSARYYFGFQEMDIDKLVINKFNITYIGNTLTSLAQDLNNGDEYIYLTDMTNWNRTASQTFQRGFIFWNYVDSTGYQYPELTYSRNIWSNLYSNDNIDLENNRIKLTSAWNHGTIKAGTKLSQSSDGRTYRYALGENITLPNGWNNLSSIIFGVSNSDNNKFSVATKYIKFLSLDNYNRKSNVTTYYKDVYIKEVIN